MRISGATKHVHAENAALRHLLQHDDARIHGQHLAHGGDRRQAECLDGGQLLHARHGLLACGCLAQVLVKQRGGISARLQARTNLIGGHARLLQPLANEIRHGRVLGRLLQDLLRLARGREVLRADESRRTREQRQPHQQGAWCALKGQVVRGACGAGTNGAAPRAHWRAKIGGQVGERQGIRR